MWTEWEVKLEKYLSTIHGVNGVPLSYFVQSQVDPDRTTYSQGYFLADTIACAPLSGAHFQSDTRKVYQILKNYLKSETAEQWIISIQKRVNGWDNFDTLRRHYSGEFNVRCHVPTAYFLKET